MIKKVFNKKGQQMVEFAVVLPIIILCMGILVTFGQLVYARMVVQAAAFDGARGAVVEPTASAGRNAADERAERTITNVLGKVEGSTRTTFSHQGWSRGNLLTYTVFVRIAPLFPVINENLQFSREVELRGVSVNMIEREN